MTTNSEPSPAPPPAGAAGDITIGDTHDRSLWRAATIATDAPEPLDAASEQAAAVVTSTRDRYQVREVLGIGGMGEVRLCRDDIIGREVAWKTLRDDRRTSAGAQQRFAREARVQGQLEHPSIVPVYDLGAAPGGGLFFTMRRVRGHTLAEVLEALARGEPAMTAGHSRRKLLDDFVRICLAVDYAHSRGVIHRDLKPSNIMLGAFGEVYVLDWGVARLAAEHATAAPVVLPDADLARLGSSVGTPGYMAPEQLFGLTEHQDARTDVYALGAILFELLTLRRLHPGATLDEIAASTRAAAAPRASEIAPDVPPELCAICARAAARDRADRFAGARELAEAVERYLDGDRDLLRRRALSSERALAAAAALARASLPGTDPRTSAAARTDAVREVTAALAFDAENETARRLLLQLFVEVPSHMPPEVEAEIQQATGQNRQQLARYGSYAIGGWLVAVPITLAMGVRAWGPVIACTLLTTATFLYTVWLRRTGALVGRPPLLLTVLVMATVASAACWLGPFVLVPQATAIVTLWFGMQCHSRRERRSVVALGVLATIAPFVLEQLGLFPPAYVFEHGNLTLLARAIRLSPDATIPVLLYTSVTFVALPALFLGGVREALNTAERQLFLQAWQLRQLLPGKR